MKILLDRESPELLRTLDALGMPAFITDTRWTILSCNDHVRTIFEYDRSDVIGRNLEHFLSLDSVIREQELNDSPPRPGAFPITESSPHRAYCFRKNGSPLLSRIAVIPDKQHRPDRYIVVVRDGSEQRSAVP